MHNESKRSRYIMHHKQSIVYTAINITGLTFAPGSPGSPDNPGSPLGPAGPIGPYGGT